MDKTEYKECDFISKIDACFPFNNMNSCFSLIEEAKQISPNAVFSVLEEIARISISDRKGISNKELINLFDKTVESFDHPLVDLIKPTVKLMIYEKTETVEGALKIMEKVEYFPGLWGALSIAYFSCDDENGIIENKYNEIRDKWNKSDI